MSLVELAPRLQPYDALIDMRYASDNNIIGEVLYDDPTARLEEEPALALANVAELLLVRNSLRLVIWDAHRPPEVQPRLQAVTDDERYVLEDSNHPKGLAIDLTLARRDGSYLDMGTDYDDFTELAHADASDLTRTQAANRLLLAGAMRRFGFKQWPYEWWHFDYVNGVVNEQAA